MYFDDPQIVQSLAGEDFTVYAYFLDGTIHLLDAKPLLEKGGVFVPLRNEEVFRNCLTVMNDTVAWNLDGARDPCTCIDLDPYALYESCPAVPDPLREAI